MDDRDGHKHMQPDGARAGLAGWGGGGAASEEMVLGAKAATKRAGSLPWLACGISAHVPALTWRPARASRAPLQQLEIQTAFREQGARLQATYDKKQKAEYDMAKR